MFLRSDLHSTLLSLLLKNDPDITNLSAPVTVVTTLPVVHQTTSCGADILLHRDCPRTVVVICIVLHTTSLKSGSDAKSTLKSNRSFRDWNAFAEIGFELPPNVVWIHAGFHAVFLLSRLPKMNLDLQKKKRFGMALESPKCYQQNIQVDSTFHTAVQQVIYEKCSFKLPLCWQLSIKDVPRIKKVWICMKTKNHKALIKSICRLQRYRK